MKTNVETAARGKGSVHTHQARPTQRLFTPVQVGPFTLTHRVVMAPLTRSRSEQPGKLGQGRPQRGLPVRLGQEVQALPRAVRVRRDDRRVG